MGSGPQSSSLWQENGMVYIRVQARINGRDGKSRDDRKEPDIVDVKTSFLSAFNRLTGSFGKICRQSRGSRGLGQGPRL